MSSEDQNCPTVVSHKMDITYNNTKIAINIKEFAYYSKKCYDM